MTYGADHGGAVMRYAAASRLLLLSLSSFWRAVASPYDTSAPLNLSCLSSSTSGAASSPSPLWPSVAAAVEGSIVWDSVYFVRIAQCGYEYEQNYAFLPLLPIAISILSRTVLSPLIPLVGHRAVLGLSGYVLNNVAFVLSALYLYRLSVKILKDSKAAFRASILFCFNPASIFYSSIYSESLYSLFSIGGLYYFLSGASNAAMFCFALSGSARSNGILNAGYFCFQTFHKSYDAIFLKRRASVAVQVLIMGALRCLCIFTPFIAFQAYGYYNICVRSFSVETRPWCKARPPLLYNFIQSHYWGVGFMRYFHLKQLPNFLLASPILLLSFCSIVHYAKARPEIVLSLGLRSFYAEEQSASAGLVSSNPSPDSGYFPDKSRATIYQAVGCSLRRRKLKPKPNSLGGASLVEMGYLSAAVLPFVLHLGFMATTAFLVMHVQVATRFLSASPSIYWFASQLLDSPVHGKKWGYLIWVYCGAYVLLGSLLFSNFYPFT